MKHAESIEKIDKEYTAAMTDIDNLREGVENTRENITSVQAKAKELHSQKLNQDVTLPIVDTRTSYALSLYAKISNISWDFETIDETTLAGCK